MKLAQDFIDSVGVNIHLTTHPGPYFDSFSQVLPTLQDLGITHIRDTAVFTPTTNATYYLYQRLTTLGQSGIKVSLVCMDPTNGALYAPPLQIGNIVSWCNGAVEQIEGGNEPYLLANPNIRPSISHEHQWQLFNQSKANPVTKTLPVLSPSYVGGSVPLIDSHAASINDQISLHPYPGCEHPETSGNGSLAKFLSDFQTKIGLKLPAQATENGYHTALQTTSSFLPVSEGIKARYLPRMLLFAFLSNIKRTYLYQLIDSIQNDPTNKESNFGLLDYNLNKKPGYFAVKNLIGLCQAPIVASSNPDPVVTVNGAPAGTYCLTLRRADGSHVIFIWLGQSGWDQTNRAALAPVSSSATVTLDSVPATVKASLFQDDGTLCAASVTVNGASITINVSDQVTALEIA